MTIHVVISYFEKEECGYLLGTDSSLSLINKEKKVNFLSEKAFFSKNTIGLLGGTFDAKNFNNLMEDYNDLLKNLDGVFENIVDGKNYFEVPLIKNSKGYRMFLAKKSDEILELYRLSSGGNKEYWHKAQLLHSLQRNSSELSTMWYSILSEHYLETKQEHNYNLEECIDMAIAALNPKTRTQDGKIYTPGPSHLYIVNFNGITTLPIP
ncbi:hypothetical protein COV11_04210 [Candidatus Woesearchaeota archaeon CG10_big_fil_rev_8_21_14_0_10_30_7]|nr:MAG: hypothetical protein COV11_04210 [Candidatus Woesearchaeota archaeon CG10_big_fil_rev_8_21_14_0_10_30_7]